MKWRVIPSGTYSASMNMALDHMLYEKMIENGQPVIRFYQWNPGAVSIGKGQNSSIVNQKNCSKHHVNFVRRPTGGNAVYHDPADLTYMVAVPTSIFESESGANRTAYVTICSWVIGALTEIGIDAKFYGQNDIIFNGKKICGNAQFPQRDGILQHGSLFIDADPQKWSTYLHYEPQKLEGIQGIKSLSSEYASLPNLLLKHFIFNSTVGQTEIKKLTPEEIKAAEKIANTYYTLESFKGNEELKMGNACITDITDD